MNNGKNNIAITPGKLILGYEIFCRECNETADIRQDAFIADVSLQYLQRLFPQHAFEVRPILGMVIEKPEEPQNPMEAFLKLLKNKGYKAQKQERRNENENE